MSTRAIIDIGSNSILLLIAKINGYEIETLHEEVNITSLGKGILDSQKFSEQSMRDSFNVLEKYTDIIQKYNIDLKSNVKVIATEASRIATNAQVFFDEVCQKLNLNVVIISGEDEAYYTAKGVMQEKRAENNKTDKNLKCNIIDVGGASTELINVDFESGKIINKVSLSIGSNTVKDLINKDIKLNKKLLENFSISFDQIIDKAFDLSNVNIVKEFSCESWIGVAGTITSLGYIYLHYMQEISLDEMREFSAERIRALKIDVISFETFLNYFCNLDQQFLLKTYPFLKKRIEVIKEGAWLVFFVLKKLNCKNILISNNGLRHGIILEDKFFT